MNTLQIQPVSIINQSATQLSAYVIHYDLNEQNCILYWSLNTAEGVSLYSGNWTVPSEILSQWGTDDSIIINALAAEKGFIPVTTELIISEPSI